MVFTCKVLLKIARNQQNTSKQAELHYHIDYIS